MFLLFVIFLGNIGFGFSFQKIVKVKSIQSVALSYL